MPRIIKPAVGSFTASNITIDSSGRVIAASSGAGAANMVRTFSRGTAETATFTAQPGTSKLHVYMKGGGGGGGGANTFQVGKAGGMGGFGFYNVPVTQPYAVPYTLGAGGAGGTLQGNGNPGSAGQASSFNTNLVANGGNGGGIAQGGSAGTSGTLNNESYAIIDGNNSSEISDVILYTEGWTNEDRYSTFSSYQYAGFNQTSINLNDLRIEPGGMGGAAAAGSQFPVPFSGQDGTDGSVVIYEDIG